MKCPHCDVKVKPDKLVSKIVMLPEDESKLKMSMCWSCYGIYSFTIDPPMTMVLTKEEWKNLRNSPDLIIQFSIIEGIYRERARSRRMEQN